MYSRIGVSTGCTYSCGLASGRVSSTLKFRVIGQHICICRIGSYFLMIPCKLVSVIQFVEFLKKS